MTFIYCPQVIENQNWWKIIILVLKSIADTKVIKKTFVLSHKLMLMTVPKEELNVFLVISNTNELISSSIKQ